MGASVYAYWTGITTSQIRSQPGFWNDCKAWGDWMAKREGEPGVAQAIYNLHAEAILTYSTDGMADEDVKWVTPIELGEAAKKLRRAIQEKNPDTEIILRVYERHANKVDDVAEEFSRDLRDTEAISEWAELQKANRMTLFVGW